jgi:hypothetical protein
VIETSRISTPPRSVRPTVRALLDGLIDYAGLFPPAKLDMASTVRNYAAYLQHNDGWIINRLIVPASRLDEFEQHAATLLPKDPRSGAWCISALTAAAGERQQLASDLARIQRFNADHADAARGLAVIDTIELKANAAAAIDSALDVLPDELFPFLEIPTSNDPRGLIAALVGSDAGAKIRTGGVTPDLYPPVDDVARFIVACARAGVPFKATAGMHHPLRRLSSSVSTHEHGFLNVFIAAALADRCEVDEHGIADVLGAESIDVFEFEDEFIRYRGFELAVESIERARDLFAISFGSCSFDEPREDLLALGLL